MVLDQAQMEVPHKLILHKFNLKYYLAHMLTNNQVSTKENLIETKEKRKWISPELNNWATDYLEFGVGGLPDGGGQSYNPG